VRLRHGADAGTLPLLEFVATARMAVAERRQELISEVRDR
jgi:hypothetical protein